MTGDELRRELDDPRVPAEARVRANRLAEAGDEVGARRVLFEAKVRARPSPVSLAGGKGSPVALLTIGLIGTASLGAAAILLGGGLIWVPASIPLVTVLAVLAARTLARRRLAGPE